MRPNQVTKLCVVCGTPFTERASRAAVLRTCRSPECRAAMRSGEHNPFYGCHHTSEARKRISAAKKGRCARDGAEGRAMGVEPLWLWRHS